MRIRSSIPDCKGVSGVKGKFATGIKWYISRANEIPNFISCQACYEDHLMTNHFVDHFIPSSQPQPAEVVWACDMPIPYIEREYEKRGKLNDWAGFVVETKARMTAQPCPQRTQVATYGRAWFVPKTGGAPGLVLCAACYSDQVTHSGEEHKWEVAPGLSRSGDHKARCAMGSMFNIRILMAQAHEKKDFTVFWNAVDKLGREKVCEDDGITDGVWYTLPSNLSKFGICAVCYAAIIEPLELKRFWVRKHDVPSGEKLLCCFNFSHPRLPRFLPLLLEMYYTLDPTALDEYASVYASIPLCLRDEDKPNRRWYGWLDCTICPECYLDFARHSWLAEMMDLRDTPQAGSTSKLSTCHSFILGDNTMHKYPMF
jgi:hypothetical protein